ncbi:RelA/SpoT [Penicillium sp. IBT 16267x]|nr:RelA/SpoT [Penicillium sp. IBT 16267x]
MNPSPMQAARPESMISAFVAEYSTKRTFYEQTARKAAKMCEAALNRESIGHEALYRGKTTESLSKKLQDHEQEGHQYQTVDDIKGNIIDLCGARIVLDSWMDEDRVKKIIHQKFEVVKVKDLPDTVVTRKGARKREAYQKTFSSYVATHYRVRLKIGYLSRDLNLREVETGIIEIQVKDRVHHSHAETEHSAYKSNSAPDPKEAIVFDVWMGAAELFTLCEKQARDMKAQREAEDNMPFTSLDQLGFYLDKFIGVRAPGWVKNVRKGNSWTPLWVFLNTFSKMNTQRFLEQKLVGIFDANSESLYSRMSSPYEPAIVTVNIFIMDRILLGDYGELGQALEAPQHCDPHKHKILTMRSTIVWLDKTFVPQMTWTCIFCESGYRESLLKSLTWLNCPERKRSLFYQPLKTRDISKMNFLGDWFEENDARHIRLAFTMAKLGMRRDNNQTDKAFEGILHVLE